MSMVTKQPHLGEVEEKTGVNDATQALRLLIGKALVMKRAADEQRRIEKYGSAEKAYPYVSDARQCPRKTWFSLKNVEGEPLTIDSLMNFAVGSAVEEAFASVLEPLGATILREIDSTLTIAGVEVHGRSDFLLDVPVKVLEELGLLDQEKALSLPQHILAELKSCNSRMMGLMKKNREEGKITHRGQLNLYLHASKLGLLEGAPPGGYHYGYLIYVVKDATKREPTVHAFEVEYSWPDAMTDLQNLARVDIMARDDTDPGIPEGYKKSRFPCTYCQYSNICWSK